ncbi:pirin family protein [Paraburkholderia phytofirmans]|uniref:pirin family protein n=1 Tax=Paraburkholderia phytofirmans TaxID=261302 RepID=UPI000A9240D8|nr:pirin family protein [Paraburkholderia phytofirmans]
MEHPANDVLEAPVTPSQMTRSAAERAISRGELNVDTPTSVSRNVVTRTTGRRHGPVTRIVSPSDIGALIKPFVFLDYFDIVPNDDSLFPIHPHSGIATITVLLSGNLRYEDTTGASGTLSAGSVEWMSAGNGVWHEGGPSGRERFRGYQIWVALPHNLENGPPCSQYLPAEGVPNVGPARIVLGQYGDSRSEIGAPPGINLLHVRLYAGQQWSYKPPVGHTVAWAHVNNGTLVASGTRLRNEFAAFTASEEPLEFVAEDDVDFIVASAIPHPHDLVLGYYSVHTSKEALSSGEAGIARIGKQLRTEGRIR